VNTINITGSVQGGTGPNAFNFANDALITGDLIGGPSGDTFTFHDTAWVTGLVDGGDNPPDARDVADFSQATGAPDLAISLAQFVNFETILGNDGASTTLVGADTPNTWTITGADSGTVDGAVFSGMPNLRGGSASDTFSIEDGGQLSGALDAGSGSDTLIGDNVATTWTLTGPDSGLVMGIGGGFSSIENLTGGSASDTFTVGDGVDYAGSIAGGGGSNLFQIVGTGQVDGSIDGGTPGTGQDVLDESAATGPVVITLSPTAVSDFSTILGNGSTTLV